MKNKSDESTSSLLVEIELITSAQQISNHLLTFLQVLLKK